MSKANLSYRLMSVAKFRFPKELRFIGKFDGRTWRDYNDKHLDKHEHLDAMDHNGTYYVRWHGEWIQYHQYVEKKRLESVPAWRRKYEGERKSADGEYNYYRANEWRNDKIHSNRDGIQAMARRHDQQARRGRV